MSKIKCLQCGEILESKFRHDFQQCSCPNQTFIDGGNDYCRCGGIDPTKIEFFPVPNPEMIKASLEAYKKGDYFTVDELIEELEKKIGPQKQPSSTAKIEAEKKNILKRLEELNEN
jgi:hypothetical protein